MKPVKSVEAFVKHDTLHHYGWEHEDKLTLVCKLVDLDEEKGVYLFQAYNHDKDEWNGVTNKQVILFDDSILHSDAVLNGYKAVILNGQIVFGMGKEDKN